MPPLRNIYILRRKDGEKMFGYINIFQVYQEFELATCLKDANRNGKPLLFISADDTSHHSIVSSFRDCLHHLQIGRDCLNDCC